ncbi:MAG: 23S rRNA (pseudouridine(1915)-N(3))-methyltransferase RlmH [Bacillota bacterium]|nr:23S rRNA (pseudouridine(1915)-N(3))-methyltransferase RlmH [Bacillota bacterium]MDW7676276.1 23S rRNA (pseudouridine(1915)-N(3))-methyltransferase RlmH [Bacillota bacterium]
MQINLIVVGKIKEKYLVNGIAEYTKRLSRYCTLRVFEVADEKAPEKLSESDMTAVKNQEGERILKQIKEGMYVIVLDLEGKTLSSETFAAKLERLSLQGNSQVALIIGGSLGLSNAVLQRADEKISFSKMTFPHQLMRLILLEQLYRSYRINRNEPYHK